MPDETRAEPIGSDTMRVRFLLPVEVDGGRRENHEVDVTADEARALAAAGRAEIIDEEPTRSDEERAALPAIGPVEPGAETVVGETSESAQVDLPPSDEHHD